MATVEVKNLEGKSVGHIELDDAVFGAPVNEHLLWEAVRQQRAKRRVGTHSTKRRSEVRGGGKKPYKQKGTGRARQGSIRAPQFVGGGRVFTPKPRNYAYNLPKQVMAAALRSALSLRAKEAKLVVVDGFRLEAIKTARVAKALAALGADSALIVDAANEPLAKSARNLPAAKYIQPAGLNVYDVLDHSTLILTQGSLGEVTARLKPEAAAPAAAEGGGA